MRTRSLVGAAVALTLLCAGCSQVQKPTNVQSGAGIGALGGTTVGAVAGHLGSLGGFQGGLIGLPIGAAVGALTADAYYADDEAEILATTSNAEEIERLTGRLNASEAQVAELKNELERERGDREAAVDDAFRLRTGSSLAQKFGPGIEVSEEPSGDIKLTILSEVLFPSGKASLTNDGQGVLSKAAKSIREEFPDYYVEVRGHTDNVPIRFSKFTSNWELSCERALSVLHFLIEKEQFDPNRMMVAGFGETIPVAANESADGRRKNRRAEIVLHPKAVQVAAQ